MNHHFYKRLLDNASDLILATDVDGRITYINGKITEWGYDKDELLGMPMLEILKVKHMGNRMSEPSELGVKQKFEMVIEDKLGVLHRVVLNSSPFRNHRNKIIGVMAIIHEVTETYALQEKLKHEERLASLGRLATGIAHEIRNPLSSIKMNLAILGKKLKLRPDEQAHFEIANEGVAGLEKIVTEFIDYAKPMPLKVGRQNLHKTIEDTLAMVEPQCLEMDISIVKDFAAVMPMVSIDKVKMQQALLNIFLNAVQASKKGGVVEIATSHIESPHNRARIEVRDHGDGITTENIQFVFDPFFTTKRQGTGLGLSIVRSIMKSHNGTVDIESKNGVGTTVVLEFPIG